MRFYFFRHSLKQKDGGISPEGFELCKTVGEELPEFQAVFGSRQPRTAQTGRALAGCGREMNVTETDALDSRKVKAWIDYIQATEGNLDPHQPFILAEVERMKNEFMRIAAAPGDCKLLVGHAGMLEALIHGLTGILLTPLRECEGAIVDYTDGKFTFVQELRRS